MNQHPPVCALRGASRSFGDRVVLDRFDLEVAQGEFVALTGPSGVGKSTALNILGLLDSPDAGEVELFGRPAPAVGSGAAQRLLRTRLGYLFQNAALIDSDNVEKNLALAQRYEKGSVAEKAQRRAAALGRVGLAGFEARPVYNLSGGEQQRTALARLMVSPRELILADEPTGSLDPANRDHVIDTLIGIRAQGSAVVVVTHDPVVASAADRVVDLTPAIA